MGGACGTYGRQERCIHGFGGGDVIERDPLRIPRSTWEDNIKIGLKAIGWEDLEGSYLAEDGDKWKAVVNVVMNIRFAYNAEISFFLTR